MILLMEIIITMLIMGFLNSSINSTINVVELTSNKLEIVTENENLNQLKKSIINYYEKNGVLPNSFDDVKHYSSINTISLSKDRFNQDFEFIKNPDNSPFTYDNSSNSFLIAVVSKGGDGVLDSKLDSNYLLLDPNEKAIIISSYEFLSTKRSITKSIVNKCNQAYTTYMNLNSNQDPLSIYNLVSTHILQPYEIFDGYGSVLNINQTSNTCYSSGPNLLDDNKSVDDVY